MQTPIDFGKKFIHTYFRKRNVEESMAFLSDDIIWISPEEILHLKTESAIHAYLEKSIKEDEQPYTVDIAGIKSAPASDETNNIVYDVNLIPRKEENAFNIRCSLSVCKADVGYEIVFVGMSRKYDRTSAQQLRDFMEDLPCGIQVLSSAGGSNVRALYANTYLPKKLGISEDDFYDKMDKSPFFLLPYKEQKRMYSLVMELSLLAKPKPLSMQVNLIDQDEALHPYQVTVTAAYKEGIHTVLYALYSDISDILHQEERRHKKAVAALEKQQQEALDQQERVHEEAARQLQDEASRQIEDADRIIQAARQAAEKAEKDAQRRAEKAIREARAQAEAIVRDAQEEAQAQVSAARTESDAALKAAREESDASLLALRMEKDSSVRTVRDEADELVKKTREEAEQALQTAKQEAGQALQAAREEAQAAAMEAKQEADKAYQELQDSLGRKLEKLQAELDTQAKEASLNIADAKACQKAAEDKAAALQEKYDSLVEKKAESDRQYETRILKLEWEVNGLNKETKKKLEEAKKQLAEERVKMEEDMAARLKEREEALRLQQEADEQKAQLIRAEAEGAKKGYLEQIGQLQERIRTQDLVMRKQAADSAVGSLEKEKSLSRLSRLINTQMGDIRSLAAAARPSSQEDYENVMAKISDICQDLLTMSEDIRAIGNADQSERGVREEVFPLADCIGTVRSVIKAQCAARHIRFIYDIAPDIPEQVIGDKTALQLAFIDILEAAMEQAPAGSTLSLRVSADPPVRKKAYFHFIIDAGKTPGPDAAKEKEALAPARRALSRMGGSIQVRSGANGTIRYETSVNLKLV